MPINESGDSVHNPMYKNIKIEVYIEIMGSVVTVGSNYL